MIPILIAAAAAVATTPHVTPPANTTCRTSASPRIIVQGGSPVRGGDVSPAIGPKQDDPVRHSARTLGGGGDPRTIGPKQDDPVGGGGRGGTTVRSGTGGDPRAIGPKQDDPVGGGGRGGTTVRSGTGGGDLRTIGPKQDDPVQPHPAVCGAQGPAAAG